MQLELLREALSARQVRSGAGPHVGVAASTHRSCASVSPSRAAVVSAQQAPAHAAAWPARQATGR
eukprot:scaffold855_cov344-Prasinococcus_capsulatus_cf.AAC.9